MLLQGLRLNNTFHTIYGHKIEGELMLIVSLFRLSTASKFTVMETIFGKDYTNNVY
jgi:hypothetical protein